MLFSTLEMKQVQVARLEKIVKSLEEQQLRGQAQRTRYEERIAMMESELAEYKSKVNPRYTENRQQRLEFSPPLPFNNLIPEHYRSRSHNSTSIEKPVPAAPTIDGRHIIEERGDREFSLYTHQVLPHSPVLDTNGNNLHRRQEPSHEIHTNRDAGLITAQVIPDNERQENNQSHTTRTNSNNIENHRNQNSNNRQVPGGGDCVMSNLSSARRTHLRFLHYAKTFSTNAIAAQRNASRPKPRRNKPQQAPPLAMEDLELLRQPNRVTQTNGVLQRKSQDFDKTIENFHSQISVYSLIRRPKETHINPEQPEQDRQSDLHIYHEEILEQNPSIASLEDDIESSIILQISRKPKLIAVRKYSV